MTIEKKNTYIFATIDHNIIEFKLPDALSDNDVLTVVRCFVLASPGPVFTKKFRLKCPTEKH